MNAMTTQATPAPVADRTKERASPVALSLLSAALLFVALVLGNALIGRTVVRADLTEDGRYTLSDATRKVVSSLSDPCQVRVYWSDEVPNTAEPVRRNLDGLLEEYASVSGGKLTVTWVKMDDAGKKEASEKGLAEEQFFYFSASKREVAKGYAGLVVHHGSKTEVLQPLFERGGEDGYSLAQNLEYVLTTTIFKMSREKPPIVAVVADSSAPPMDFMHRGGGGGDKSTVFVQRFLEPTYGTALRRSVDLEDPVPADVSTLVVFAPKDWSEKKAYHLEQFVLRGGKALLLLNPVDLDVAFRGQQPTRSGLEDWLKAQGVELAPGVVADFDESCHPAVMLEDGRVATFPFWVRVLQDNLDRRNPAIRDFKAVTLYMPSEVVVDADKQKAAGRTTTPLAWTSASGWRKDDATGIDRFAEGPEGKVLGKKTLMVALDGTFTSAWKGKRAPDEPEPPPAPPADAAMGEPAMGEPAMDGATPPTEAPMGEPAMTEPAMEGATPPAEAPTGAPAMAEPAMDGAKGPEGEAGDGKKPAEKPARLDEGKGLLVVLGDADLVSDDFSGGRRDRTGGLTNLWNGVAGFYFVTNVVDWMTGSADLVSLRARESVLRKLDEVSDEQAGGIKAANYAAAPLLLVLVGLLVYFVRRHRR
ncbi:MAG: GldG family protein [Planctomycetes bacterium]|nr:GldG family protein [Planctomycetota bacterium]